MKRLFARIKYLFTAGEALDVLIKKEQNKIRHAEYEQNRYMLDLCFKHRQEPNRSHYSSQNCDYCKLLKKLGENHDAF